MLHLRALGLGVLLALYCGVATAQDDPDWKLYSDTSIAQPEMALHAFFLQNQMKWQGDHVQVWTKGISVDKMDKAKLSKEGIDKAAKKLIMGYMPPLSQLKKLSRDDLVETIGLEQMADEDLVSPEIKTLDEIDCGRSMARTLSIIITHNGKFGSSDNEGAWMHVPPESSTAYLSTIVCGMKH